MRQALHLIVADGKYGNHLFLAPLRQEPCGVLVRLRCDRVLYRSPGAYRGRGRPRVHGDRFAFKDPETWGEPQQVVDLEDEQWGRVRLRRWDGLHAHQEPNTVFSALVVEAHQERDKPATPLWLAYQLPPDQPSADRPLPDLWYAYQQRWPVEPSTRFRKQYLAWTLPRFQEPDACDRWTLLVTLAQWQLFLARELVKDRPLPWQAGQEKPTPERVLQGLAGLFSQIDTPTQSPQPRGKSPGWPKGRARTRRERHRVVKKTKKKT
jgi:hypothetical protein